MHKTNYAKALQLEAAQVNPAEKPLETERPARFSISRNRDQASTKVRYVETSTLTKGCSLCE
ncbi:hypothetical protein Sbal195_0325 [Shewanella baltica OS195]|uniref:Uncharacterized protein n=1 Tax=Shewanella baltica (strain OS195) TaxID=399599 RepID=A9KXB0_SHEB9|nr:hypothetical protein [Shewanella baltica]ABX47506.1 hypothetical protein Sbal195_0325 [Shewanella baltica OS195]ADT92532.1 hypothetical protein Sbal678_0332 [Shewanella baltica OS678]